MAEPTSPHPTAGAPPGLPALGRPEVDLSIALCTWQGERWLRSFLDSIAAQARPPDELVVQDDASDDGTVELVRAFAHRAPFDVRLEVNEERIGSTANFARALARCRGRYLALADQDDVWYPVKLERLADELDEDPTVTLAFSDADLIGEDGRLLGRRLWDTRLVGRTLRRHPVVPEELFARRALTTGCTMLMRRRVLEAALPFPPELDHPDAPMRHDRWLLNDEWCELLARHDFLVGISIDGPPELHDVYRVDKRGEPTSAKVLRGLELLQSHGVQVNVLCTVNRANQDHPLEVYRYFRDDLGLRHVQLIPIVERDNDTGFQEGDTVTDRSVEPEAWGRFLTTVFDEWVVRDVGDVFVQLFEAAFASWLGLPSSVCIFRETCGDALALEHNGDLYSCDHFVEPAHLLGNVLERPMAELVASPQQVAFGRAKADTLPRQCRDCRVRFACNGECPKNRFTTTADGEAGLNYLCDGYFDFFTHVDGCMRIMADLVRGGRYADEIRQVFTSAGRNEPCPCGSGEKTKRCHGR